MIYNSQAYEFRDFDKQILACFWWQHRHSRTEILHL